MTSLSSLSNEELLARLSNAVGAERAATADVIEHLVELERRQLHFREACGSLTSYCVERLGYSEDSAGVRVRVAKLVQWCPRALEELRSGAIHLTGLYLLARHLTDANADRLLTEARGKSRRELQELLARWFPRPDVLPSIAPILAAAGSPAPAPAQPPTGSSPIRTGTDRIEPLSASSYRVEFTASRELRDKLELAQNLLSHAVPTGDLAEIVERAVDQLILVETQRRCGTGRPRKRRPLKPGSRHIPVEVARAVWERDGAQCAFVDKHGRRCSQKVRITLEHKEPFALGGPPTVENICLLCAGHNDYQARQVFGDDHIERKQAQARAAAEARAAQAAAEAEVAAKVESALTNLGFKRKQALAAIERARSQGASLQLEPLFRATVLLLTPPVVQPRPAH